MKALSLKQPWTELVVSGKKTIELRKWNTSFRGKFLVHASSTPDLTAMRRFGFQNLPLGAIVGQAELIGVKKYPEDGNFDLDKEKHLANHVTEWGGNGFLLKDAKRLPILKVKGKLNFWELKK